MTASALLLRGPPRSAQTRQLEVGLEALRLPQRDDAPQPRQRPRPRHPSRPRAPRRRLEGDARLLPRGLPRVRRAEWGTQGDETDWVVRQGYAQYWWGEKLGVRVGKQRIAWGSGFAWNPTNRLEPPKNALNTTLEQEGALAARVDWVPAPWASVVLVGATTDATPRDLPLADGDGRAPRHCGRPRALPREGHGRRPRRLGREEPAHARRPRPRARRAGLGRRPRRGGGLRGSRDVPAARRQDLLPGRGGRS